MATVIVKPASAQPGMFASGYIPTRAELLAAPLRTPRPSRLEKPLDLPAGKLADGLRTLGIETVGALLEHLPRDRREARAIAQLRPGEQATVAVEVESIAARPVRRRGMRPLVEATVFDETGAMGAAFFNQPWLVDRYRPGTRLLLHGKAQAGGASRSPTTHPGASLRVRRGRGRSRITPPRWGQLDADRGAGARAPRRARRCGRAAAGADARRRAPARSRGGAGGGALPA